MWAEHVWIGYPERSKQTHVRYIANMDTTASLETLHFQYLDALNFKQAAREHRQALPKAQHVRAQLHLAGGPQGACWNPECRSPLFWVVRWPPNHKYGMGSTMLCFLRHAGLCRDMDWYRSAAGNRVIMKGLASAFACNSSWNP